MSSGVRTIGQKNPTLPFHPAVRAGDFIFVSGTSARRAEDSIAGAAQDAQGLWRFDIRAQTRAVIENIRDILASAGARLTVMLRPVIPRSAVRLANNSISGCRRRGHPRPAACSCRARRNSERIRR